MIPPLLVGCNCSNFVLFFLDGIADDEAEHQLEVSSVLSSIIEQIESGDETKEKESKPQFCPLLPTRNILWKSTLSSLPHFNELSDDRLCDIPFDQCCSSYTQTDYLQNNFNTVLSVDREVLGFKDYSSASLVKSCYNKKSKSSAHRSSKSAHNYKSSFHSSTGKVVFHESQNIVSLDKSYRELMPPPTAHLPPSVQAGLDPVIIINSPPAASVLPNSHCEIISQQQSSEQDEMQEVLDEEEEDDEEPYQITTLESSCATSVYQHGYTNFTTKRGYDFTESEDCTAGSVLEQNYETTNVLSGTDTSFPITMVSGHYHHHHSHHKRFRGLDVADDSEDFLSLTKSSLLDVSCLKHPITATTNDHSFDC